LSHIDDRIARLWSSWKSVTGENLKGIAQEFRLVDGIFHLASPLATNGTDTRREI
jgi:hypothetical protein